MCQMWNLTFMLMTFYSLAPTPEGALSQLQLAFNTVQEHLYDLKLVLNADRTKVMLSNTLSNTKTKPKNHPSILSSHGLKIECVSNHWYLGILIDDSLSFANHIQQLVKRLKLKLGFYFSIKSCLSFKSKKRLVAATFICSGLRWCIYASLVSKLTCSLHCVSWSSLRFITHQ